MALKDKKGRWIDSKGDAIPVKYIDPIEKKRDQLVENLILKAKKLNKQIIKFKTDSLAEIEKYIRDTEKTYGIKVQTKEGNKILSSFSNTEKVMVKVNKSMDFDDRLALAKNLIDECIKRWAKGSDDKIKLLIEDAFRVDKQGNIDKERILSLRKIKIKSKDWQKAMEIISDSIRVVGKRTYIIFMTKNDKEIWESIPLDIARC